MDEIHIKNILFPVNQLFIISRRCSDFFLKLSYHYTRLNFKALLHLGALTLLIFLRLTRKCQSHLSTLFFTFVVNCVIVTYLIHRNSSLKLIRCNEDLKFRNILTYCDYHESQLIGKRELVDGYFIYFQGFTLVIHQPRRGQF